MTIEEMLRSSQVQTAENGLVYAVIAESAEPEPERGLAKMVAAVPRTLVPRLGRSATYFVPWLYKQRRSVVIGLEPAAEGEARKELCHHLDVKPAGNLLLISQRFYQHDSYGLAMEFFDKIAYLASLDSAGEDDFAIMLRRQLESGKPGELTPEAWEWRAGLAEATPQRSLEAPRAERAPAVGNRSPDSERPTGATQAKAGRASAAADEAWLNYRRAAEADALGLYMAALHTDIFYEDLFEPEPEFPALDPDLVYERMRAAERMVPPNRGYSLQMVRQRARRRRSASSF